MTCEQTDGTENNRTEQPGQHTHTHKNKEGRAGTRVAFLASVGIHCPKRGRHDMRQGRRKPNI
jgi:hypothetical protein